LAFHPTLPLLAASYGDNALVLWDLIGNRSVATVENFAESAIGTHLRFSPNGDKLIAQNGPSVVILDTDPNTWKKSACRIANRELTDLEKNLYGIEEDSITCALSISDRIND